jgi:phosphotriesterase-related protein
MRRRTFLSSLSALTAGALVPDTRELHAQVRRRSSIHTVLGPIAPRRLGRTLMHEHILVDFIGADEIAPGRYDPEEAFRVALPHLQKLKSLGCATLLECTPNYIGRDPELLRRLGKATGLNILTNTGLYAAAQRKFVPKFAYRETADQLAERWVAEFEKGIPPSGIRPGFIKIGVDGGALGEIETKLVQAAARTHRRTGLAIAAHTGGGDAALAELDVLKEEGVSLSAFIWVHAQEESDSAVHQEAARRGAWVEFDGISPKTIEANVERVMAMKRAGLLSRTLISQDAGWYNVGEPGGGNYRGYDTLFVEFLPALRRAGASESDVRALLERNPRAALTGGAPS